MNAANKYSMYIQNTHRLFIKKRTNQDLQHNIIYIEPTLKPINKTDPNFTTTVFPLFPPV